MNTRAAADTILLVDDEPNVSNALKRLLMREPFKIFTATSGEAALKMMAEHAVDVVVADEQMPGMCGSQLLAVVRRRYPRVVRFILSGQATLDAAVRAINEGEVQRFFLKPCNPVDLCAAIKQAILNQQLAEQSRHLLRAFQEQTAMNDGLKREDSQLLRLDTDTQGDLVFDPEDADGDVSELLEQMHRTLPPSR
jgi:DNA-binding NtrC family response regulator